MLSYRCLHQDNTAVRHLASVCAGKMTKMRIRQRWCRCSIWPQQRCFWIDSWWVILLNVRCFFPQIWHIATSIKTHSQSIFLGKHTTERVQLTNLLDVNILFPRSPLMLDLHVNFQRFSDGLITVIFRYISSKRQTRGLLFLCMLERYGNGLCSVVCRTNLIMLQHWVFNYIFEYMA